MDVNFIADRTGLPSRTVRYVLDEGLLPAGKVASRGRGAIREFIRSEAIVIAAAGAMVLVGVRRAVVRATIKCLVRAQWEKPAKPCDKGALWDACVRDGAAEIEIGDSVNCKLNLAPKFSAQKPMTTGWLQIATRAALGPGYQPLARVVVDLDRIKSALPHQ